MTDDPLRVLKSGPGAFAAGFVGALVLVGLGGLAFVSSGAFNIAASAPHGVVDGWALQTAMRASVRARADEAEAPRAFTREQVMAGFVEFDAECAMCHGAPGVEQTDWARGLNPAPPNLAETAGRWSADELHWIIQHGVKMTGMPAMGEHHADEDIWAIVAFVQTLPDTNAEQYAELRRQAAATPEHADDGHHHH